MKRDLRRDIIMTRRMEKKKEVKKLFLVCNAHLNPVWMWDWQEGAAEAISTFYSAAELADEFDYLER